ncbi:nephrin-like [Ylistrum balloti]|uniref:nephrin-like n=1 Tax=Ylistrum balloti TaxID=509963 RepID=UPI002905D304|nr:nephrin-like [Ylistrum balloti]
MTEQSCQNITPVYIQINTPVTLTCPADDQATILSWTGPGGTLYVTGTTADADLDDNVKLRISARHTGGSYTLTFTEFRSSDIGIYRCTVDGTVGLQMVIVQGVTSASPVYTRQGGTLTLQCPDTGGSTSWVVTSTGFIYASGTRINPNLADPIKTRLAVNNESGIYSLQISNVQLSDVREYRCVVGVSDTFYHLLLYIPPDFPKIENTVSVEGQNRTIGTEDGSMNLTCNAFGGTPASNVSWIKGGVILVTSANAVQYRKVFTREDDRNMYTCQSSSPALTSSQTTSVLIYLDLKPRKPTISGQMSTTVNTNLQVVCESTGSRPAADIEWNVGGTWQSSNPTEVKVIDSSTETYNVTSTLSLQVTRPDDGKSVYCRANNRALSGGTESEHKTITVLYPPDIHINYVNVTHMSSDRILTCSPDGNPAMYQFRQWTQTAEDGTVIRQFTGISSSTESILTLPDSDITRRYEDTGYYICSASNGIPGSASYTSGSVFFVVEAPPVVITNTTEVKGQIGSSFTIEVEFYSRPAVSETDVTWTKGTKTLTHSNKTAMSIVDTSVRVSFHGVQIQVKGYVAAITIHSLMEPDFGNYTVTIENSQGRASYMLEFKSASPPLPPDNVIPLSHDSSSITIQWTRRFNGGAEQWFIIGYKTDISKDFDDLAAIPDSHDVNQTYQITGLKAATTHFIRIYAENKIGHSDFVFLNHTTAVDEEGPNIGPLIGGMAGAAVCLTLAVVAGVIYKRKSNGKDDAKPNNLPESSDGLKPNILYESAGANYQPAPGPSSEYAIVCKPNKKNGAPVDPNSVYAVVDKTSKGEKDSKNDLYAEVMKQPKGKGGKEQQKPLDKRNRPDKKQEKGGKKNKKKATTVAGMDDYENIIPNNTNSKDSSAGEGMSSRKKNPDELLYLDVEFKDNHTDEHRVVVHGIENRCEYADVDFSQQADPLKGQEEVMKKTGENTKGKETV